jgi:hypothetical protein
MKEADTWYYARQGVAQGPFDEAAMRSLADSGEIGGETLIWQPCPGQWQSADKVQPAWSGQREAAQGAASSSAAPSPAPRVIGKLKVIERPLPTAETPESKPKAENRSIFSLLKGWFGGGKQPE